MIWGAISPAITDQNLPEVTRVTPTLLTENKPLSEWIVKDLGAKKIAVIADTSDYGTANAEAVNQYILLPAAKSYRLICCRSARRISAPS